jgi:glycosyltransferase involved in cell wall biosynthesis
MGFLSKPSFVAGARAAAVIRALVRGKGTGRPPEAAEAQPLASRFGQRGVGQSADAMEQAGGADSVDPAPWNHPFLTSENIRRFRSYSGSVWEIALDHARRHQGRLKVAFAVNIAQNMHKWARLAEEFGVDATLYPHPFDLSAINAPEWEEFDGEHVDVQDGPGFRSASPNLKLQVACRRVCMDGPGIYPVTTQRADFLRALARAAPWNRSRPRYGAFWRYPALNNYRTWAHDLIGYDVVYAASSPIAAYLSGQRYCAHSVGGDLQIDCGRADEYGEVMHLAFRTARFTTFTNPFTLAYCRRLGLVNGVYVPYPMDDHRYCPGEGQARKEWEARFGPGPYVLATARIDNSVKGNGPRIMHAIAEVARARPSVRFVFLAWGQHAETMRKQVASLGLERSILFLLPVGKRRLIDYYRSTDIVLDQFVYGYYGATGLEAAAVGKPLVMHIRENHYGPFYDGDVAPVENVREPEALPNALLRLVDEPGLRREKGQRMRDWLVRNHGAQRTMPILLALLRFTADQVALPPDLASPLCDPTSKAEDAYHAGCLRPRRK